MADRPPRPEGSLSTLGWPAVEGMTLKGEHALPVEHAVWGKVHGQKSEYRWIARSPGFNQRLAGSEFRIGAEDRPASFPLWRLVDGRYYASWCYRSPASDASTRSDFLEKQLLEWTPDRVVAPAAAAFCLLAAASGFTHRMWYDRYADPEWSDARHVLTIPPQQFTISQSGLEHAIAEACGFWAQHPAEMLAQCFADLDADVKPAFLANLRSAVPPTALAALLLPLPRQRADRVSLAGWIPADRLDDGGGGRWDVIVGEGRTGKARAATFAATLKSESLQSGDWRLARGVQPWVQRLLDFAAGPDRWLDVSALGPSGAPASPGEERCLLRAVQEIRGDALQRPAGFSAELIDARRRHLEHKAAIIEAACDRMSARAPDARHRDIVELWNREAAGHT